MSEIKRAAVTQEAGGLREQSGCLPAILQQAPRQRHRAREGADGDTEHERPAALPESDHRQQEGHGPVGDLEFVVVVENERGQHGDADAAQRAAEREVQVEIREMPHCRAQAVGLAVANHARREQRDAVATDLARHAVVTTVGKVIPHQHARDDEQRREHAARIPARVIETDDEAQQVERERQNPQERNHRDVDAEFARRRHEQHGRQRRQRDPQEFLSTAGLGGIRSDLSSGWGKPGWLRAAEPPRARAAQRGKAPEPDGPAPRLGGARKQRFNRERITDEREQRRDIRQRVEAIRRLVRMRETKPTLQQRSGCGEQQVGQPERGGEEQENAQRRLVAGGGLPSGSGDDGEPDQREREQRDVCERLRARLQSRGREMRVGVTAEQEGLEKEQTSRPHARPAAEPRQDVFADERLDEKKQERAQKSRESVKGHRCRPAARRTGFIS